MKVTDEDMLNFNCQIDKIRGDLIREMAKFASPDFDRQAAETMNRMEVARRVFNYWVETGKVVVPD